jgi:D-3-phosphoglycerate dehydrogenase
MSKKVVLIRDFTVRTNNGLDYFKNFLEKDYGAHVVYVEDRPEITNPDDFSKMFLTMETQGPDVLSVNNDMVKVMEDADFVISHISAISSKAVNNARNLSAVCILRSGVENIDVPNATAKGVKVVNAPGRLAVPVSEFTVGLIISEMKNIARSHANMVKGDFSKKFYNREFNYSISGNKVGIVGYGTIGRRVAAIMKVMGAEVLVFDPYVDKSLVTAAGFEYRTLNELFKESDVISIHYRLTEETKGLIGKEQFALMKPHAFFFNTARAGLVDEAALLDTLVNHRIGGAGLDVFHQEPLPPDHPFLKLDNVTLTAHLAGTSSDSFKVTCAIMEDAIRYYFRSGVWKNTVN